MRRDPHGLAFKHDYCFPSGQVKPSPEIFFAEFTVSSWLITEPSLKNRLHHYFHYQLLVVTTTNINIYLFLLFRLDFTAFKLSI